MADVRDAIVKVQTIARALTGMKEAPNDPRLGIFTYPFAVSYAGRGSFDLAPAGMGKGLHTIVTEMHMASDGDFQEAIKHLYTLLDPFANDVLDDPTLGATVATIVSGADGPPLTYTLVNGFYAGVKTIALRWELRVKIQNAVT